MFIKDSILILPYEQDLTIKSLTAVYLALAAIEVNKNNESKVWIR